MTELPNTALRLRALREKAGLSVPDMARALGWDAGKYKHYENPARLTDKGLNVAYLRAFAEVLSRHGIDRSDVMAIATGGEPLPPGLAEPPATYVAQIRPIPPDVATSRALAPQVERPEMFQIATPVLVWAIHAGDSLIMNPADSSDGLVVANIWETDGSAYTVLRRRAGNNLISPDPDDAEPVIVIDDTPRVGIRGRIVAVARTV